MTPLLARQLRRLSLGPEAPPGLEQWVGFLDRVERSYDNAEKNRYLMERSLRISSEEMQELYEDLREASESMVALERDRLRTVIDTLSEGLCFLDPDGKIVVTNRSGSEMLGLQEHADADISVTNCFIVPNNDRDETTADSFDLEDAVRNGSAVIKRNGWVLRSDGVSIPALITVVPVVREEEVTGAVLVFNDLREKLQARRALAESEDRYRNLFDLSPVPSLEVNAAGLMKFFDELTAMGEMKPAEYCNENYDELLEVLESTNVMMANPAAVTLFDADTEEEIVGALNPRWIDQESRLGVYEVFESLWRGGTTTSAELRTLTIRGESKVLIMSASSASSTDDVDYTRLVLTFTDITERKADEERMTELMRLKDEFLATVSHELRTPLSGIVASSVILEEGITDMTEDEHDELVGFIADESRDLAAIIEDLLVGARAEVGALTVAPEISSLDKEVGAVTEALARSLRDQEVVVGALELPVYADPIRMRQIIRNLLTNAIRYGNDYIEIRGELIDGMTRLEVRDNGKGVDMDDAHLIFEPYQRTTVARGTPGSVGLGLTVSRQLARIMSGDLTYRRDDDLTVFELVLPTAEPTSAGLRLTG